MDINFKCIHCGQDLTVDSSGAGVEIACPSCGKPLVVPNLLGNRGLNPISSSAGAREVHHFVVPQRDKPPEAAIEKAKPRLETAAKETDRKLRVKTFRRTDCVEVGKDHFDEVVSNFLISVGEENVKTITPITYTHQDLASRQWITDFGVMVVYKG